MPDPVQTLQRTTCPACGFRTLVFPPDQGERCAVCGWMNDFQQLVHPDITYGENAGVSLRQAQEKFLAGRAGEPGRASAFPRDSAWRALHPGEDPSTSETGGSSPVCFLSTPDPADYVPYWLR